MTWNPNYTRTTPVDADKWTRCTCAESTVPSCLVHGKWPDRYTVDHWNSGDPRVAELAETCRVLTELAQQLVDACDTELTSVQYTSVQYTSGPLRAALDAAKVLGITPTTDQP